MLLVFGTLPRPVRTTPAPSQLARQHAIERAKKEVSREQARRRIAFARSHTRDSKAKKASQDLQDLPSGASVLVWRTRDRKWKRTWRSISIEGETVVVQLDRRRRIYRSTCVRPYNKSTLRQQHTGEEHHHREDEATEPEEKMALMAEIEERQSGPCKVKVKKRSIEERAFAQSIKEELQGLVRDGTLKVVSKAQIEGSPRNVGSPCVGELKKVGGQLTKKGASSPKIMRTGVPIKLSTRRQRFNGSLTACSVIQRSLKPVNEHLHARLDSGLHPV